MQVAGARDGGEAEQVDGLVDASRGGQVADVATGGVGQVHWLQLQAKGGGGGGRNGEQDGRGRC